MSPAQILDILLGASAFAFGWMLKVIWGAIQDLQSADREVADRLSRVEIFIAQRYATKEDVDRQLDILLAKLDRIEAKLDTKVDKG